MFRSTLIVSAALALALTARAGAQQPAPDLILRHARIYTAIDAHPEAAALAIRGDRLVAVGEESAILALEGPATQVVDLGGQTVVPGLTDAHGHFTNLGSSLQRLDFRGLTSYAEVVAMVKKRAAAARPGEWILGRAWDQNLWADKSFPAHDEIDAAAPNNPVYLTRVDGHAGLANAKAMQLAGVTRATEAPEGGRLIRDANGNPTGVFVDGAQRLINAKIPPESDAQLAEQILLADRECRRLGLTMVHDAGNTKRAIDTYKRLADAGTLQTRIYAMARGSLAELAPFFKAGPITNYHDYHVIVRAIKIVADGALGSRGAAMLEDYSDEPGNKGLLTMPPEEVYAQTLAASKARFQTCIHAIGDRANREVLDVFARVQNEVPGSKSLRMRDEHAQILSPQDIPRFAQLGVVASMQPTHCTSDMPWVPARIGQKRTTDGAYVWRKLMKTGVVIASGSDFPVEQPNPMLGLYAAVTRQDVHGNPPDGWAPDQRMTRMEALQSFTINAAYAAHMEKELGTLEAGKLADLVVLSGDVMTEPAKDILTTTVIKTMIGGRWVYGEPSAAQRAAAVPPRRDGARPPSRSQVQATRPKLVVLIMVDQMRADYVDRFKADWTHGLKRLVTQGAWFRHAEYPYLTTVTCAGHATVGTGAFPHTHGIVQNAWWDRATQKMTTCTEDASVHNIGYGVAATGGDSAVHLTMPTFADVLRSERNAHVVTLSLKARSAIMPAGHGGDAVTWLDDAGDGWATSSAFADAPLAAVEQFTDANPIEADFGKSWTRALPASRYSGPDDGEGEAPPKGWTRTFPHELKGTTGAPDADFRAQWQRSPFADAYLGRFAAALAESMALGKHGTTDMLSVSFSSPDLVGHGFGPRSQEMQDMYMRLDETIGTLLDRLDALVGKGRYVVALTADHGVTPLAEQLKREGADAGRLNQNTVRDVAQHAAAAVLGAGTYVAHENSNDIYFAPGVYAQLAAKPGALQDVVDALLATPGIAKVYRSEEVQGAAKSTDRLVRAAALSYFPGRSGDLILIPKPGWEFSATGAMHGTATADDQHVPILLMGSGIKPGQYQQAVTPADVVPTLAALCGVTLPQADGHAIRAALRAAPSRSTRPPQ